MTDNAVEPAGQTRPLQIAFDGNIPAFLGVVIINLVLTVVTLGIYRFWAKTRVRHYLWENTTFDGEPLEYRGRGLELLIGAVLAFLIFLLPAIAFSLGETALRASGHIVVAALLELRVFGGIYYLFGVGFYRAERYLISRTSWRGIRGGMTKGGWRYGGLFLKMALFQAVTLGFGRPYAQIRLWNARMNDLMFGSAQAMSEAKWRPLFRRYVLTQIAAIVVIVGAVALVAGDFDTVFAPCHGPWPDWFVTEPHAPRERCIQPQRGCQQAGRIRSERNHRGHRRARQSSLERQRTREHQEPCRAGAQGARR